MNDRIKRLRENSINAVNRISAERALLMTDFYRSEGAKGLSVPMTRAKSFEYLLENKVLFIGEDELIVGERGPGPKATPTYPEICVHSMEDLHVLDTRPKIAYRVDEAARAAHRDIVLPYWKGRSQRERLFGAMSPEWIAAYKAGIFTEFQEQRTPGHTALGDKIYRRGMLDLNVGTVKTRTRRACEALRASGFLTEVMVDE